jgi:hypothetical protein
MQRAVVAALRMAARALGYLIYAIALMRLLIFASLYGLAYACSLCVFDLHQTTRVIDR